MRGLGFRFEGIFDDAPELGTARLRAWGVYEFRVPMTPSYKPNRPKQAL